MSTTEIITYTFIKVWDLLLLMCAGIIGLINSALLYNYLKRKKPSVLDRLENKISLINLPLIMNIDPYKFINYLMKIEKDDDKRIVIHKRVQVICLSVFVILLAYSLIIKRFLE